MCCNQVKRSNIFYMHLLEHLKVGMKRKFENRHEIENLFSKSILDLIVNDEYTGLLQSFSPIKPPLLQAHCHRVAVMFSFIIMSCLV